MPAHSLGHYGWKQPFRVFVTGCDRPSPKLEAAKFRIRMLVGIYCYNIPTHTLQSRCHGFIEIAKIANIPTMAEKCINCTSARPTPPNTNPMESGPGITFPAPNRKNQ